MFYEDGGRDDPKAMDRYTLSWYKSCKINVLAKIVI